MRRMLCAAAAGAALVVGLAACGGKSAVDSGGLTARDRKAAQSAMDALSGTNISLQLASITHSLEAVPAACRVHRLESPKGTFRIYVFWIPWLGSDPYTWLHMTVARDASSDTFLLGTAKPVLPGGRLTANGQSVDPYTQDATILSKYGPAQAKKNHQALLAHAGDAFSKPGAACQVLQNGDLRLVPNP